MVLMAFCWSKGVAVPSKVVLLEAQVRSRGGLSAAWHGSERAGARRAGLVLVCESP